MQKPLNVIAKNAFKALVAVIFIGGLFHLILLSIVAMKRAEPSYVNPIDFLGIGYAFPSLANNKSVAIVAWLLLFLIYLAVLYLVIHYQRYLGIVQNTKSYKKIATTATKKSHSRSKTEESANNDA